MPNSADAVQTVDAGANALHQRGWSCGDMEFNDARTAVWQVYAHRGDQRIVARAPTQNEAWAAAVEQSTKIGSD